MDKAALRGFYSFLVTRRDYRTCLTKSVSYRTIHEKFGWGSEKIRKMIKTLEDLGAIEFYSGFGFENAGTTNIYAFPLESFTYDGKKIKSNLPESLRQKKQQKQCAEVTHEGPKADDTAKESTSLSKAELLKRINERRKENEEKDLQE